MIATKRQSILVLSMVVVIAATVLSAYLGRLTAVMYDSVYWFVGHHAGHESKEELAARIGPYWGGVCGMLAGALWCLRMYARTRRGSVRGFARYGAWMGVGAGVMATILLHLGLMIATGLFGPDPLLLGLVFGVPSGAVLGMILGETWSVTVNPGTPDAQGRVADSHQAAEDDTEGR